MIYYLIPVRVAIIQKTRNSKFPVSPVVRTPHFHCQKQQQQKTKKPKCWWGCGEKWTLVHSWWKCKLVQLLWKTIWKFLKKLKIEPPYNPAIPLLDVYTKETRSLSQGTICTPMFIPALFVIAKTWKQSRVSINSMQFRKCTCVL